MGTRLPRFLAGPALVSRCFPTAMDRADAAPSTVPTEENGLVSALNCEVPILTTTAARGAWVDTSGLGFMSIFRIYSSVLLSRRRRQCGQALQVVSHFQQIL